MHNSIFSFIGGIWRSYIVTFHVLSSHYRAGKRLDKVLLGADHSYTILRGVVSLFSALSSMLLCFCCRILMYTRFHIIALYLFLSSVQL